MSTNRPRFGKGSRGGRGSIRYVVSSCLPRLKQLHDEMIDEGFNRRNQWVEMLEDIICELASEEHLKDQRRDRYKAARNV